MTIIYLAMEKKRKNCLKTASKKPKMLWNSFWTVKIASKKQWFQTCWSHFENCKSLCPKKHLNLNWKPSNCDCHACIIFQDFNINAISFWSFKSLFEGQTCVNSLATELKIEIREDCEFVFYKYLIFGFFFNVVTRAMKNKALFVVSNTLKGCVNFNLVSLKLTSMPCKRCCAPKC